MARRLRPLLLVRREFSAATAFFVGAIMAWLALVRLCAVDRRQKRRRNMDNAAIHNAPISAEASTRPLEPQVVAANSPDERQPMREQAIRERAYAIWEEEGRPDGRHLEHWHRAQNEIISCSKIC
jgi:Protein of unknown function (DUF2934)